MVFHSIINSWLKSYENSMLFDFQTWYYEYELKEKGSQSYKVVDMKYNFQNNSKIRLMKNILSICPFVYWLVTNLYTIKSSGHKIMVEKALY